MADVSVEQTENVQLQSNEKHSPAKVVSNGNSNSNGNCEAHDDGELKAVAEGDQEEVVETKLDETPVASSVESSPSKPKRSSRGVKKLFSHLFKRGKSKAKEENCESPQKKKEKNAKKGGKDTPKRQAVKAAEETTKSDEAQAVDNDNDNDHDHDHDNDKDDATAKTKSDSPTHQQQQSSENGVNGCAEIDLAPLEKDDEDVSDTLALEKLKIEDRLTDFGKCNDQNANVIAIDSETADEHAATDAYADAQADSGACKQSDETCDSSEKCAAEDTQVNETRLHANGVDSIVDADADVDANGDAVIESHMCRRQAEIEDVQLEVADGQVTKEKIDENIDDDC